MQVGAIRSNKKAHICIKSVNIYYVCGTQNLILMKKIFLALFLSAMSFGAAVAQRGMKLSDSMISGGKKSEPLAITGSFGFLNSKLRLQYEGSLAENGGYGVCLNYYFVNWTGPKFDVFARVYSKKSGNKEGFFGQVKLGYGNLSGAFSSDRWSTIGGGVATGYKFLIGDNFCIETLFGAHIYSPPPSWASSDPYNQAASAGEQVGWLFTTGLPFDWQLKFGYSF